MFKFNGSIKLTETCSTTNGVITSDWVFKDEAYIELPISCSISSEKIKCGSLKLTSSKMTTVEVGPIRMKKITKQHTHTNTHTHTHTHTVSRTQSHAHRVTHTESRTQ